MDPLSITTSVIALIGAANNVYNVLQSIRHADRGLQALTKEVNTLTGFLRSIEKAIEDFRGSPYALTQIDPGFWRESKVALSDCQETLDGLGLILMKQPNRLSRSNTLFRRARVAAELRSRAGDIASFREKISMSIISLQTLLQVINVSLSLRSNESQDHILRDLKELKEALKRSSKAATVSYSALFLNEQDIRLVHHLKGLIRAAHEFHASASVTASTVMGGGEIHPPMTEYGDDDARSGCPSRMPSMKRRRIEAFLSENQQVARANTTSTSSSKKQVAFDTREVDTSHTFNTKIINGLSKLAQQALQKFDLLKAEDLLKEALKWYNTSGSDDTNHCRRLQTQLALCNLLQGNRQEARDIILDLVDTSKEKDSVALPLLHALALLQSHELDFEGAQDTSKRLWQALQGMPPFVTLSEKDAMRILATSYKETGDNLLADAIEAEVPDLNLSEPLPRMVDFLVECEALLDMFFGVQDCSEIWNYPALAQMIHKLPIATQPSSLQLRQQCKSESSSMYEDCSDQADDDASMEATPNPSASHSKEKKGSWSNLRVRLATWRTGSHIPVAEPTASTVAAHSAKQRQSVVFTKKVKTRAVIFHFPTSLVPRKQTPIKSKRNWFNRKDPAMEEPDASGSQFTTTDHVVEQTKSTSKTSTTIENEVSSECDEHTRPLQRAFSFREGEPDHIPPRIIRHELDATGGITELMDTSPQPPRSSWSPRFSLRKLLREAHVHTSQRRSASELRLVDDVSRLDSEARFSKLRSADEAYGLDDCASSEETDKYGDDLDAQQVEDEIYHLLGPFGPSDTSAKSLGRTSSSASGGEASSSESDTNDSSVFDRLTQSSTLTSIDCTEECGINDDCCSIPSLKRKVRPEASESNDDVESYRLMYPFEAPNGCELVTEHDRPPSASHFIGLIDDAINNAALSRSVESRGGDQGFARRVTKLCNNTRSRPKVLRRTTVRKRVPAERIARLARLFSGDSHGGGCNTGCSPNKSTYTGPDAVAGPFTDLEQAGSSSEEGRIDDGSGLYELLLRDCKNKYSKVKKV